MKKLFSATILSSLAIATAVHAVPYRHPDNKALLKPVQVKPENLQRFGLAYAQIAKLHVNDMDEEKVFNGAIRGMLKELDPHSSYLGEKDLENLKIHTDSEFPGVGIVIATDNGMIKVISPIDGTPADKAGIKAGDYILAVDNKPVMNTDINKAVELMRGKPDTKVKLTVVSKTDKKPREVTITREVIHVDSVKSKLLPDNYGYIRVSQFQTDTASELKKALKKLNEESAGNLKGLVLDLRNDPGGLLTAAVDVSDTFLDSDKLGKNKSIVSTKGKMPQFNAEFKAKPGDLLMGKPLVVLINRGSASASEIVAGAMQDHRRAIVLGERSFGKGSVQAVLPLTETTGVKLTTALYYTPKGRSIQADGIEPDIFIDNLKLPEEDEDVLFLQNLRESGLDGHLKNKDEEKKQQTQKAQKAKVKKIAQEDYQLYSAMNVLKSMKLLQPQPKVEVE
jgi:carboxyl-terminal processing protease